MATIVSQKAGNWSDPATWTGNVRPSTGDTVTVNHALIYDLFDRSTLYARIDINTGGAITHDSTKPTAIQCSHYLRVNGGRYQAGPNSKTLFYTPNITNAVEGAGFAGLYIEGAVNNSQLILEGSVPMPETALTQPVAIGAHVLTVANASGFSAGEYIAVYHDQKDDGGVYNFTSNNYIGDEGFIIQRVVGNDIYIQQRVAVTDTITNDLSIGGSTVKVANVRKWQPGFKVFIDNEVFTIASLDESRGELNFTTNAISAHNPGAPVVETGAQKPHIVGDHVYKIATVTTANTLANANTLNVANASMLEVGDRIIIEGNFRNKGREFEAIITAKSGNLLGLDKANPYPTTKGYIVTKSSRDCVVATTDYDVAAPLDTNRCFIYYIHGAATFTGRKCVLRYVEIARFGHNNETYGITIRGDFNRSDMEREIRGCSVRDGRAIGRGLWLYSAQYLPVRNNLVAKANRGINPYDQNGGACFNNITIGITGTNYTIENQYYQNYFQYNIALNGQIGVTYSSTYTATNPDWHNIYKHVERSMYVYHTSNSLGYGFVMKNSFEDVFYKQIYFEGNRAMLQDINISYATDASSGSLSSSYADYDSRHMSGAQVTIINKDFIRGNFEIHGGGGIITKDEVIHMGNGWSYKYNNNLAATDLRLSQQLYVKYGIPVKVVAYMRKGTAYNGTRQPYIMAKGLYQPEIFSYMENRPNQWVRVELNFTPTRSEMIQIGVGGRGTVADLWIDPRVSVTTHDLDLIQGPYSTNLMFGLEQVYQNDPSVVLGGVTI